MTLPQAFSFSFSEYQKSMAVGLGHTTLRHVNYVNVINLSQY